MRHLLHVEDQQSSICRFLMHLYHGLCDKENPEPFMNPNELSSYMNWPGDKLSSVGGAKTENAEVQSTSGNARREDETEPPPGPSRAERPGPSCAARDVEDRDDLEPKPRKTQYVISSDSEDEEGHDEEGSVGDNDASSAEEEEELDKQSGEL